MFAFCSPITLSATASSMVDQSGKHYILWR
jgi:hypothetical protein